MSERSDRPLLGPEEREEFEEDVIRFCDRELDLLGDVEGAEVLYVGGASLLWLEGLSQRIGETGSLTALDLDLDKVRDARRKLHGAELGAPVRVVAGDVFNPPFDEGMFDLAYSAGLLHELDVKDASAGEVIAALVRVVRPGGRVATGDFVDFIPAIQLEDERLQQDLARESSGRIYFGVGSTERLVSLHEMTLDAVSWQIASPFEIRHLSEVVLNEDEPDEAGSLSPEAAERFRKRRAALRERIAREGYTRLATAYVEGIARQGVA